MLRMLDAITAVARAVHVFNILVIIEDGCVRTIADGVYVYLQAVFVGVEHILLHRRRNLGTRQAGGVWSVKVRLKEPCGRRTKTAVGVTFQTADAEHSR